MGIILDENPTTPLRQRRYMQELARLLNRGVMAGDGLGMTEGVMRVNVGDGITTSNDFIKIDLVTASGLELTGGGTPNDQLRIKLDTAGSVGVDLTLSASGLAASIGQLNRLLDGSIYETIDIDVIEDTGAVKLQIQADGGGDLTCRFAGVSHILDTTPADEVTLTAGTDIAPQLNYVYVTEAGGNLTLTRSTTGWPATAHCPVATVLAQSAASVATDGVYKLHAWTDHVNSATENGHLSHIGKKLREIPAHWMSGVAPSDLVVADPDAFISTTAGVVFQVHDHTMPAIDMQTPAPVFIVNDPTTKYKRITTFDDITQDALGGAINNRYMNIVLWGVVSENTGDCKLFINLPVNTYTVEAQAIADADKYAVYAFPQEFAGTAFLIAMYTLRAKDSGAWSQSQKLDLRGLVPSTSAGGGGITDHARLFGLNVVADHPGYVTLDGNRPLTGNWPIGGFYLDFGDTTAGRLAGSMGGSNGDFLRLDAIAIPKRWTSVSLIHSMIGSLGTDDHHPQAHTIASHSDTTATGAELETLTNLSEASGLHYHADVLIDVSSGAGPSNPINPTYFELYSVDVGVLGVVAGDIIEVRGQIRVENNGAGTRTLNIECNLAGTEIWREGFVCVDSGAEFQIGFFHFILHIIDPASSQILTGFVQTGRGIHATTGEGGHSATHFSACPYNPASEDLTSSANLQIQASFLTGAAGQPKIQSLTCFTKWLKGS